MAHSLAAVHLSHAADTHRSIRTRALSPQTASLQPFQAQSRCLFRLRLFQERLDPARDRLNTFKHPPLATRPAITDRRTWFGQALILAKHTTNHHTLTTPVRRSMRSARTRTDIPSQEIDLSHNWLRCPKAHYANSSLCRELEKRSTLASSHVLLADVPVNRCVYVDLSRFYKMANPSLKQTLALSNRTKKSGHSKETKDVSTSSRSARKCE